MTNQTNNPLLIAPEALLHNLARRHFGINIIETRDSDSLDFRQGLHVWSIRAALVEAYRAGRGAGEGASFRRHAPAPRARPGVVAGRDGPGPRMKERPDDQALRHPGDPAFGRGAARRWHLLPLPGSLRGGAAAKVVGALLARGLAREEVTDRTARADSALNTVWRKRRTAAPSS